MLAEMAPADDAAERPVRLRSEELEWREIEGEVVALDLRNTTYFGLNRTGAVLWDALQQGATRSELVSRVAERFAIDEATAGPDVDAFLADLENRGLLEGA
jgi:hypothetical protein